jgi:hypothetical protein
MTEKHRRPEWWKMQRSLKPKLMAQLPAPCPRCGGVMMKGMKLDLGHRSRTPGAEYDHANVRLEHRSCNRKDGQRITMGIRQARKKGRMPGW